MKFLISFGGSDDWTLTTPGHKGIPAGIIAGNPWAADNQAFTVGFDPELYFPWLETMRPFRDTCLFVAVPDVVGDAAATLISWHEWASSFDDWPLAFVAQDGSAPADIPADATALFIGGTTEWKESGAAVIMIKAAQRRGLHIHIGRVNWARRYNLFAILEGSHEFTCDGTRQRYEGTDKTRAAWAGYMAQKPLITI